MSQFFQKVPVTIEARELPVYPDEAIKNVADWCGGKVLRIREMDGSYTANVRIPTLEGVMLARPGDFIVQSPEGGFSPLPPEIFAQEYVAVAG